MEKPINYFEGILQLRHVSQLVIDFVEDSCIKENPNMVSKAKKVRNGFDLYFQSNKFLSSLGKRIQRKFTGELRSSASLHTRDKQTSKDLYRLTVLFRQYDIVKGDTLKMNGESYQVIGINKKILMKSEKSGKKISLPFDELKKRKVINN